MIEHKETLSMSETPEYLKNPEIKAFVKDFVKLKLGKAKELRKKLEDLELIKLNPNHLSKLIDFLPEDKEDINKILTDVNLDENETSGVLQTIKEFI